MTSQWLPRPEDQSKIFCTSLPTAIILRELAPPEQSQWTYLLYQHSCDPHSWCSHIVLLLYLCIQGILDPRMCLLIATMQNSAHFPNVPPIS